MTTAMTTTPYPCSRCLAPANGRYCRRCGMASSSPTDFGPRDLTVDGRSYRVLDRIGVGSRSSVYRCTLGPDVNDGEGTFKLARDPVCNAAVAHEAETLRLLQAADVDGRFTPFFPTVVETFEYVGDHQSPSRHANLLRVHPNVRSPADDLFTLADVRGAHPDGLDARDMAWVWRRLLDVLGFAHTNGVTHGTALPVHVLVDPADHRLVLIGWSGSAIPGQLAPAGRPAVPVAYRSWVSAEHRRSRAAADVRLAALTMVQLLTPVDGTGPAADTDPAVVRHLDRCTEPSVGHPWDVRDEFDELTAALWGPGQFRPLTMPPKQHSVR